MHSLQQAKPSVLLPPEILQFSRPLLFLEHAAGLPTAKLGNRFGVIALRFQRPMVFWGLQLLAQLIFKPGSPGAAWKAQSMPISGTATKCAPL